MKNIILLSNTHKNNKKAYKKQKALALKHNLTIKSINVLKIKPIPNSIDDFIKNHSNYSCIVFSSKNGVRVFFKLLMQSDCSNMHLIDNKKLYAINKQTYKEILKYTNNKQNTINANCANSQQMSTRLIEHKFIKQSSKTIAIIRAKKVITPIINTLKSKKMKAKEFKIYKTKLKTINTKKHTINKGSFIVFTSPSTIKGFFANYKWHKSYNAICIGKSTAKYLPKGIKCKIPSKPLIKNCIKLAIAY